MLLICSMQVTAVKMKVNSKLCKQIKAQNKWNLFVNGKQKIDHRMKRMRKTEKTNIVLSTT